jgi:hypothetical protein
MVDKRVCPRQRVLKAGTTEFDGDAINCTARNRSTTGAALGVASPVRIPEHFTLVADGFHLPRHIVWRKEKRIGVAFD